ncbi:MAG TPA: DHA2 family efflux MFS transporter permease subunit [Bacillota bacterium]|nr:DHA2 family efflux MFS transporter permease subunit [Bacillota bacterium]
MQDVNSAKRESFWLPLLVVVVGAFSAILNNSSINVALPKLMAIFGVTADEIQWVLTAYMLVSGMIIPVTGFVTDQFGAKRVYLASMAVFAFGSVLCSIAWSNGTMIAARVIQGIGGGATMPVSMAIVYSVVPREKIGTALGVWGMAAVCAPAIGPTLGGYVIDHFSWHFLFTMNIPAGIVGILLSHLLLPEIPPRRGTKLDTWGFTLSTAGCFSLLLALSQGHNKGWSSFYIVTLFIISFFLLLLFVLVEITHEQPMLNLRLFKNTIFSISVFAGSLITIGLYGGVFLIPLFAQNLMLLTPYQTGLLLMPSALATAVIMPVSGLLFDRFGAKGLAVAGLSAIILGTWNLSKINLSTSNADIILNTTLRSVGIALAIMPITTAGMNTVPVNLIARASALSNVIRQVAASFGIAMLTAIMQNRQAFHYGALSESVSIDSAAYYSAGAIQAFLANAGASGTSISAVSVLGGIVAKESIVRAIDDTFLVAALFIVFALPFSAFLGKTRTEDGKTQAVPGILSGHGPPAKHRG